MTTELWQVILAAAIPAVGAIICQLLINRSGQKVVVYRIEQLEKKQDKYNNLQERTYRLEKEVSAQNLLLQFLKERKNDNKKVD